MKNVLVEDDDRSCVAEASSFERLTSFAKAKSFFDFLSDVSDAL